MRKSVSEAGFANTACGSALLTFLLKALTFDAPLEC